jgi:hypothetical protein
LEKEGGRNILPPFGVLKSLAELAARRRQSRQIIFCCDMCVGKKYPSGCQFAICAPTAHKLCAQQAASLLPKNPEFFRQFRGINIPLPAPRR